MVLDTRERLPFLFFFSMSKMFSHIININLTEEEIVMKKLAIGNDHVAVEIKKEIIAYLEA